jgi:hypothetical protein
MAFGKKKLDVEGLDPRQKAEAYAGHAVELLEKAGATAPHATAYATLAVYYQREADRLG